MCCSTEYLLYSVVVATIPSGECLENICYLRLYIQYMLC